jgi:uncharacterized membrane protein (DUF4010 family)
VVTDESLYLRFIVALGIGLAAGIERGWKQRDEPSGKREAGIRTFTILALIGFAAGIGAGPLGALFAAAVALGVSLFIITIYYFDLATPGADRGGTTEVAALLVFLLGALAGAGQVLAAAIAGVVLVLLLDLKDELHAFLRRLQDLELTAGIKLLVVSVVLLPVLPNKGFGPGGVLNPYELWWAVVVIAAIGFAGYVAMRVAGAKKGALMMGLLGGLVSSTSLTVSASRASQGAPAAAPALAAAVATAQSVMFVRTGLVVGALNSALLQHIVLPLAFGALAAIGCALWLARRALKAGDDQPIDPGSPDMLNDAIKFVLVVACVLVLAYYAQLYAGDVGVILSGLLSGAIDVDAASVSASRLSGGELRQTTLSAASFSVAAALVSNSVVKGLIARTQGTAAFAKPATIALGVSAAAVGAGVLAALLLP